MLKCESWPARDHMTHTTCQSLAQVIAGFTDIAEQTCDLSEVFGLFLAYLSENSPSVRLNCANAFVKVSIVFDQNHNIMGASRVGNVAKELISEIENQKQRAKVVAISDRQHRSFHSIGIR